MINYDMNIYLQHPSSSLPSPQSSWSSQTQAGSVKHFLFLQKYPGQSFSNFPQPLLSSDPSAQSFFPSHCRPNAIHVLSSHVYSYLEQWAPGRFSGTVPHPFSSSPIGQFSWPSHTNLCERHVLLSAHRNHSGLRHVLSTVKMEGRTVSTCKVLHRLGKGYENLYL